MFYFLGVEKLKLKCANRACFKLMERGRNKLKIVTFLSKNLLESVYRKQTTFL